MTRRILIADDHFAVRQGLEGWLRDQFPLFEFGFASTQPEVFEQLAGPKHWDLILLDISMPGRGLESLREMKDASPSTGILIYTIHPEEQLGVRALRAGADGYVSKDRPPEELAKAVRKILEGKRYISDALAEKMAELLSRPEQEQGHELLSDREFQILRMLGKGMAPGDIAAELHLSIKTVSTYRTRVLQKLNLETTGELIRYAVENMI